MSQSFSIPKIENEAFLRLRIYDLKSCFKPKFNFSGFESSVFSPLKNNQDSNTQEISNKLINSSFQRRSLLDSSHKMFEYINNQERFKSPEPIIESKRLMAEINKFSPKLDLLRG